MAKQPSQLSELAWRLAESTREVQQEIFEQTQQRFGKMLNSIPSEAEVIRSWVSEAADLTIRAHKRASDSRDLADWMLEVANKADDLDQFLLFVRRFSTKQLDEIFDLAERFVRNGFRRAQSHADGDPVKSMGELLKDEFPGERETRLILIASVADNLINGYKIYRSQGNALAALGLLLLSLCDVLYIGVMETSGGHLHREERREKLIELASEACGLAHTLAHVLALVLKIRDFARSFHDVPDALTPAANIEIYFRLYRNLLTEWLNNTEALSSEYQQLMKNRTV